MSSLHPDPTTLDLTAAERDRLRWLAVASHRVITDHQDAGGAYPASPDFSPYAGYAWLRDGAFTAEGVSRYGDAESAGRFHDWAARTLASRRGQVDGLLAVAAEGRTPARAEMLRPGSRSPARTAPTSGGTSRPTATAPGCGPW